MSKPKSPWRPIETAPEGEGVIAINHFYPAHPFSACREGGKMLFGISFPEPTHWIPIPPLPEGER